MNRRTVPVSTNLIRSRLEPTESRQQASAAIARYVARLFLIILLPVLTTSLYASDGKRPRPMTATDNSSGCDVLPRPRMRLRLAINSTSFPEMADVIRGTVDEIWYREGIVFDWLASRDELTPWDKIDAWIIVQDELLAALKRPVDRPALAAVSFDRGVPAKLIRASIDAAVAWLQRDRASRTPLSAFSSRSAMALQLGDNRARVNLAVAHAVAHEIGHYVLGSAEHSSEGLMRPAFLAKDLSPGTARAISLDTRSQGRLRVRLTQAGTCP